MLRKEKFERLHTLVDVGLHRIKIFASEKTATVVEDQEDKLMLTRQGDFITLGGKFPRLTKKDAKARLKEIKKLLMAL